MGVECCPQRHQTQHHTLQRTRSLSPVSGTYWGVNTGPAHSNVSKSGALRPVVHCRSARGIGCRRASGGPRPVITLTKHPLCVRVWCAPDAFGGYLTVSAGLKVTVRDRCASFNLRTRGCL